MQDAFSKSGETDERILTAVCDVYDAMVSKRCYKEPHTPFEIMAQFHENQFSFLDAEVVRIFLENLIYLLIGMRIRLSTGEVGEVVFIWPSDYTNPIVKVGARVFATNSNCRCVAVETNLQLELPI